MFIVNMWIMYAFKVCGNDYKGIMEILHNMGRSVWH